MPRVDDRLVLNGISWVLRSGAFWSDMPERYGPPTTIYIADDEDQERGTIYVQPSRSEHPSIAAHRELIHYMGGSVGTRIANAAHDLTNLLAGVEVVAEYQFFNVGPSKLKLKGLFTSCSHSPVSTSPSPTKCDSPWNRANGSRSRCLASMRRSAA